MVSVIDSERATALARTRRATWIKQTRQLHLYLGVFFAPALLFFAFSGALQLFGLHESHPGEPYHPPTWIETLASIHKDQRLPSGMDHRRAWPRSNRKEEEKSIVQGRNTVPVSLTKQAEPVWH